MLSQSPTHQAWATFKKLYAMGSRLEPKLHPRLLYSTFFYANHDSYLWQIHNIKNYKLLIID
jgi:hypothetical protein